MRVAIVSNWHEKCGNADYARDLRVGLLAEGLDVITFTDPLEAAAAESVTAGDVIIVNWHPSRVQFPPNAVHDLHKRGMKVIGVLQNSFSGAYYAAEGDPLRYTDATVAHQVMGGNVPFTYIPVGIHLVPDLPETNGELRIGIAGFPYYWKRFNLTAKVAHHQGGRSLLIAPTHDMGDTDTPIAEIRRAYPTADIVREFLPVDEVIRRLASCTINIFWYQHMPPDDLCGQSGSVRMGVAARRPIIISRHPKLETVAAYEDDVYVAETEDDVHRLAHEIWMNIQQGLPVKRPKKIIDEIGWDKTAKMYVDLIRKVTA